MGKLRITANAFASSLLDPSTDFFQYYAELPVGPVLRDFTYHDMLEVRREVDVEVVSLDELLNQGELPYRDPPDFLSIDTQGSELSIIKGAKRAIIDNVLGMVVEVEIKEMYSNQPRLGDIVRLLEEFGFHFAGFPYLQEVNTFRGPVGFRGKGFPAFGDALFLRRATDPAAMTGTPEERFRKLRKLAFISVNFGYIEYALDALLKAERLRGKGRVRTAMACRYETFLDDVLRTYSEAPKLYPRFWGVPEDARPQADKEDASEGVESRRAGEADGPRRRDVAARSVGARLSRFIEIVSSAFASSPTTSSRSAATAVAVSPQAKQAGDVDARSRSDVRPASPGRPLPPVEADTAFEALLVNHGFDAIAALVRTRRIGFEAAVRAEGPSPGDGPDFGPEAVALGTRSLGSRAAEAQPVLKP
jgi:hypothetical protein